MFCGIKFNFNLIFCLYRNEKMLVFYNFFGMKNVFVKFCFYSGLLWIVGWFNC